MHHHHVQRLSDVLRGGHADPLVRLVVQRRAGLRHLGQQLASTITPAPAYIEDEGDTWEGYMDTAGLLGEAQSIISSMEAHGELTLTTRTPTSTPTATETDLPPLDGVVIVVAVLAVPWDHHRTTSFQYDVYLAPTATSDDFPGCSPTSAIYGVELTGEPDPADIPKMGPFDIAGYGNNCYFQPQQGQALVQYPTLYCSPFNLPVSPIVRRDSSLTCVACLPNGPCDNTPKACTDGSRYLAYLYCTLEMGVM